MQDFTHYDPYIVISICEPGGDKPPTMQIDYNCKFVLPVYIHDVNMSKEECEEHGYKALDKDQATEILNTVERFKDKVNTIVVHCAAGVCRSAGCAAALLWIYNNGDDSQVMNSKRYRPNSHVRHLIMETAVEMGLVNMDERLERRKQLNGNTEEVVESVPTHNLD